MTVTYKIANPDVHERQKGLALATLVHVINAIGLKAHLPLPGVGTPTQLPFKGGIVVILCKTHDRHLQCRF